MILFFFFYIGSRWWKELDSSRNSLHFFPFSLMWFSSLVFLLLILTIFFSNSVESLFFKFLSEILPFIYCLFSEFCFWLWFTYLMSSLLSIYEHLLSGTTQMFHIKIRLITYDMYQASLAITGDVFSIFTQTEALKKRNLKHFKSVPISLWCN